MLPVEKMKEPQELVEFKNQMIAKGEIPTYDVFKYAGRERDEFGKRVRTNKETPFYKLRHQLLVEQKFVCAYCGQQVKEVENENEKAQMKTEHFIPQNGDPEYDLGYGNLLACCLGNDNNKGAGHCDSMKGEKKLTTITNPSLWQERDDEIIYSVRVAQEEVAILSMNRNKETDLTGKSPGCLNLNHDVLRKDRFSIYKNVIERKLGRNKSAWNREQVQSLLDDYGDTIDGHHKPFKDFVLWTLFDWLKNEK